MADLLSVHFVSGDLTLESLPDCRIEGLFDVIELQ
jgi:hypothetical protein